MSSEPTLPIRFFTKADSSFFLGLLALVQSLRLQGHDDPVTVLDLGLTADQRLVLNGLCDLVRVDGIAERHPWFVTPYPHLLQAEGIVIYIDADVIVTSRLDHVFTAARRGMVCAAPDPEMRWFADWGPIFELEEPLRPQVYVNSGFVAFSIEHLPDLQRRWWECCDHMARQIGSPPSERTNPIALPDQDSLNALLMSEVPAGRVELLPENAMAIGRWELARTTVVDLRRLECRYAGQRTTLLHSYGRPKPWEPNAWRDLRRTSYVRCLRRLLSRSDRPASVDARTVPVWLRPGAPGALVLRLLFGMSWIRRRPIVIGRAMVFRLLKAVRR